MSWHRVDRFTVLLAASTLGATTLVGWLTPYGPLDHRGCGMDASFYMANLSLWFFIVRWSWRGLKFLQATVMDCFTQVEPSDREPLGPAASHQV